MKRQVQKISQMFFISIAFAYQSDVSAQAFEPLNFSVFANQRYDTNLFRLPDGAQPGVDGDRAVFSETAGSTIKFDKIYGLQHVIVDLSITRYAYNSYGNLDYTGNEAAVTYNWSITPELTGNIIFKHSNLPTDFAYAGFQTSPNPTRSDLRRLDIDFRPGAAIHPRFSIFQTSDTTSQRLFQQQNSRVSSSELSLVYEFRTGNTSEFYARRGNGSNDGQFDQNAIFLTDPQFKEVEIGTRAKWVFNGLSTLSANIGYLDHRYATFGERNYSGIVGGLQYKYLYSGKTSLEVSGNRSLSSSQTVFSSYYVEDSISITPVYLVTEKIALRPSFSYSRRIYEGSPFAVFDELRQMTRTAGLAADWSIRRNLGISLSLMSSNRTSNDAAFQFRDRSAVIGGQFRF